MAQLLVDGVVGVEVREDGVLKRLVGNKGMLPAHRAVLPVQLVTAVLAVRVGGHRPNVAPLMALYPYQLIS